MNFGIKWFKSVRTYVCRKISVHSFILSFTQFLLGKMSEQFLNPATFISFIVKFPLLELKLNPILKFLCQMKKGYITKTGK
jgi:hypothetical protein